MDMDDPWGSPWADEVQNPTPIIDQKQNAAISPATPVRASTLAGAEKTNSPWNDGDDDGFGDWAALPDNNGTTMGLDGVDDRWEGNNVGLGSLADNSGALSVDWDLSTQESHPSQLLPSPVTESAGIIRQPSPDPWATETIQDDSSANNHRKETRDRSGHEEDKEIQHDQNTLETENRNVDLQSLHTAEIVVPEKLATRETGDSLDVIDGNGTFEGTPGSLTPVGNVDLHTESQDTELVSSRPSSSPSERSHHDELAQESPRTSFDDEPKRPQMPRQVSSKVQELVQHFDGLAKKETSEPSESRTTSAQGTNVDNGTQNEVEEEEEDDDFGEFEEGQSDDEISTPESTQVPKLDPAKETIEKSTVSALRRDFGPVVFDYDLSILDKVFTSSSPEEPAEKVFIPDTVPHDSFSSVEERKTWYRISRYGTMRKYNTGDDENYIRVNWARSKIRDETLKIVGRWMEEDRISGHVVLGGGSKGSSLFGWGDSKAAPVPLSRAFESKKPKKKTETIPAPVEPEVPREWPVGLVRKRSTSKSRSPKARRKSSIKAIPSSDETKPDIQTSIASFGWNNVPENSQHLDKQIPVKEHKPSGALDEITPPPTASKTTTPLSPKIPTSIVPSQVTSIPTADFPVSQPPLNLQSKGKGLPSLATLGIVDDDDDWGELVSSPATPIGPIPSAIKEPNHKKSQSFGGLLPVVANISTLKSDPPKHSSKKSFDDVLVPQPANIPSATSPDKTGSASSMIIPVSAFEVMPPAAAPRIDSTSDLHSDPWASADFSFFDSAPSAPLQVKPITKAKSSSIKSVSFGIPPATAQPLRPNGKSREEIEQDKIVQSVVKSLPDLSYMLRR